MSKDLLTLEGDKELEGKLLRMAREVQGVLEEAALAGAGEFAEAARPMAPGPHVYAEINKRESRLTRAVADVGPDKEHWYYQFFETGATVHEIKGTQLLAFLGMEGEVVTGAVKHPGMAASPFLQPAYDARKGRAIEAFGEVVERELDMVVRWK